MKNNKGFTLIEVGLVLFVIGILVVIFIPNFTQGIRYKSQSQHIISFSTKVFQGIEILAQECNISKSRVARDNGNSDVASLGDRTYRTLITTGRAKVLSTYLGCWDRANLAPIKPNFTTASNLVWWPAFNNTYNKPHIQYDLSDRQLVDQIITELGLNPSLYIDGTNNSDNALKAPIGIDFASLGPGSYYIQLIDNSK